MNYTGYTALDVTQSDAVTTVSMNHPPLNLLDALPPSVNVQPVDAMALFGIGP